MNVKTRLHLISLLAVFLVPVFASPVLAQFPQVPVPEEKTIPVFGKSIHYWEVGSGPTVVLVHGLGSSKFDDWRYVVGPLSRKFHVLALDQIGFGHSDKPLLDYRIQTYVDFLNEFLHQVKVEKASLVGESLGGWISAMYALETSSNPQMVPVERLVLVDAAGLKQDKPIPDLNPSTLEGMRSLMQVVFYDTKWLNDDVLRRIFADKLSKNDGYTVHSILSNPALGEERLDDKLGGIHAPTLVVWGKEDVLLEPASGQRYAAGISGAKLVTFDACGHVPPVEKAREFIPVLMEFLGGAAAATAH
jgi:pimeloyl-ACP methyl ester carboxylesterase